ncbi:sporangia induced mitogen-activated protein kinase [Blastocystis sp. ATCC 50177/Nand II]|uniref:Sporangia induced mitogen-activated protein kinase n=1 Tax=Blastocystis sp. subtype 1 (strain ATCC 50177 / NandII) TaxID=478820 RepID=A0A196SQ44_BLAHN|nr:sporangia induced mitogen-activated protein kinase [Blastocystis sp. ATCC 50177/Nand II]
MERPSGPFDLHRFKRLSSPKQIVHTPTGILFSIDRKYSYIKNIGEGSYGVVISVEDMETRMKYAVKKIPNVLDNIGNGFRVYREIQIMRHCNHDNVLKLIDVDVDPERENFTDLMTMELMETDLNRVIYSNQVLTDDHIQFFTYQIFRGLKYLHSAGIIHRDLKPSNLLVNSNCDLKICDFNLARDEYAQDIMTEYVQTRWYRAPEVMLSSQQYNHAVDVWSVGCIMAELLNRRVLFKGTTYINQLQLICNLLGLPEEKDLDFVTNERGLKFLEKQNKIPQDLRRVFPTATEKCLDLLQRTLCINPKKRITVDEALAHPYFEDLHDPTDEPVCDRPFLLNVDDQNLTKEDLQVLFQRVAREYHHTIL